MGPGSLPLSFEAFLADVRPAVERGLAEAFDEAMGGLGGVGTGSAELSVVLEATRALTLRGGKRLRAALLAATYEACAGPGGAAAVVGAGVALELLQAYFLIHDDWMDGDEMRRGGPAVHAALAQAFQSGHDGAASAVLAGDFVAAMAQRALLGVSLPAPNVLGAAQTFARIQEDVVLGQLLDVHGAAASRAEVERTYDRKTGSYTARGPVRMGALLAGAGDGAVGALDAFAQPLGVAFQLRDDLLGIFGDPRITGKPAGNDLRRGKRTALVVDFLHGEQAAQGRARGAFEAVFGRADATEPDVAQVVEDLVAAGSKARVEARILELLGIARAALRTAPLTEGGRSLLAGAVEALGARPR